MSGCIQTVMLCACGLGLEDGYSDWMPVIQKMYPEHRVLLPADNQPRGKLVDVTGECDFAIKLLNLSGRPVAKGNALLLVSTSRLLYDPVRILLGGKWMGRLIPDSKLCLAIDDPKGQKQIVRAWAMDPKAVLVSGASLSMKDVIGIGTDQLVITFDGAYLDVDRNAGKIATRYRLYDVERFDVIVDVPLRETVLRRENETVVVGREISFQRIENEKHNALILNDSSGSKVLLYRNGKYEASFDDAFELPSRNIVKENIKVEIAVVDIAGNPIPSVAYSGSIVIASLNAIARESRDVPLTGKSNESGIISFVIGGALTLGISKDGFVDEHGSWPYGALTAGKKHRMVMSRESECLMKRLLVRHTWNREKDVGIGVKFAKVDPINVIDDSARVFTAVKSDSDIWIDVAMKENQGDRLTAARTVAVSDKKWVLALENTRMPVDLYDINNVDNGVFKKSALIERETPSATLLMKCSSNGGFARVSGFEVRIDSDHPELAAMELMLDVVIPRPTKH